MPKPDLGDMMMGKRGSEAPEPSDSDSSGDAEYESLGNKIKTAIKSEDGLQIAMAVKALVSECMKGNV